MGQLMQTRMRELPAQALTAGGLAVLGGVTLRRLGIEFERAWLRSYDGPLLGESPAEYAEPPHRGSNAGVKDGGRRWVSSPHQPRISPRATRLVRSSGG